MATDDHPYRHRVHWLLYPAPKRPLQSDPTDEARESDLVLVLDALHHQHCHFQRIAVSCTRKELDGRG